ncbi:MAG: sodium-translocating pyrophosphatase, partial [Actinomycetota bacterium]
MPFGNPTLDKDQHLVIALLASEGGWQDFTLKGGEWLVLALSGAASLLAIAVGFVLAKSVLAQDDGTDKMKEIAGAIQVGALAYLKRQFRTIGMILVPVAIIVFVTSVAIEKPDGEVALSFITSGVWRTVAFLLGCVASGLTGYIGMTLATRGNIRTAAAARRGSMREALDVAFRTGGVAGMFTVGLGLLGATIIIALFQNTSSAMLVGFGFGGSLIALFLRVGGGIFTKAADVGADLVGKVEAGIPEDDPRNPAVIADNVGDNVGDCAGMAADLFESYEVTLVASIILGVAAFNSIGLNPALGLVFPLAARAIGVIASIAGVFAVRAKEGEMNALKPINRGFLTASIITVIGTLALAVTYVGNPAKGSIGHAGAEVTISGIGWRVFGAVLIGLILAQVLSRLTEYFTGTEYGPVEEIAESAETGPATVVLSGTAVGLESSVYAIICIAVSLGATLWLGGGNVMLSLYLVALCGMGMLATTGVIVSEDTFGPVADNAAGIAEMAGEFEGEPRKIMVSLDAVGNTTKAVTKGFAIGSAVIAAVALFASFIEIAGAELKEVAANLADGVFRQPNLAINVADPKVFIGLLIGGAVPFLFSALSIRAVGRTAGVVVQEVRKQFADGKIMRGEKQPDYAPVIDICTAASLRELTTPALLAVLTPVIVGFGIDWKALGAFLAAVILVGQLMARLGWRKTPSARL